MPETDWLILLPQYATVVALIFTAYVWWANNRDRKIEPLRRFVGQLNYLDIRKRNLDVLSDEHMEAKVRQFQKFCGEAADGISVTIRDGGANISSPLVVEASNLGTELFRFSQLYVETDQNGLRKLNELWQERQTGIGAFLRHVYAEIESHKFRRFLINFLKNSIEFWKK